ncbi:hypothetical protein E2320_021003 [Naja naja]|nr:hypothetical protein E2320_021003 [Naja naja]
MAIPKSKPQHNTEKKNNVQAAEAPLKPEENPADAFIDSSLFAHWGQDLSPENQRTALKQFQYYGYNAYLSDRLPLDRPLPDFRPTGSVEKSPDPKQCMQWNVSDENHMSRITGHITRLNHVPNEEIQKTFSFAFIVEKNAIIMPSSNNSTAKRCKNLTFPENLPEVSIVFIFVNEALSVILRSIHSAIDRTPAHLLKEIILVDDNSNNGE